MNAGHVTSDMNVVTRCARRICGRRARLHSLGGKRGPFVELPAELLVRRQLEPRLRAGEPIPLLVIHSFQQDIDAVSAIDADHPQPLGADPLEDE